MIPKALVIFDATDPNFYSGKLSPEFSKESDGGNRPWFFQPDDWMPNNPDDGWYGSIANSMMKILPNYSIGFASREKAQIAADSWLETLRKRTEGTSW